MAILANQKVLTHNYWKTASQLEVGDYVFDSSGKLVKVTLVQEYRSDNCYTVYLNDHLTVSGDLHLTLPLEDKKYRVQECEHKGVKKFRRKLKYLKVEELLTKTLKLKHHIYAYSIKTAWPLKLPEQTLPVPPFIFGFWFFNRRSTKRMAPPRGYAKIVHEKFKDHGYKVTETRTINTGEKEFFVFPTIESHLAPDIPYTIPNNYLMGSEEQRLELLRGIIHAKYRQYSKVKNSFRFTSANYQIVRRVQFLAESLGLKTRISENPARNHFLLTFKCKHKLVEEQILKPIKQEIDRRFIRRIEPIGSQLCVHIKTDGKDGSFLVGEGFIACH